VRRTDAATARDEVDQEFERADTMDPDTQTPTTNRDKTPKPARHLEEPPPASSPPSMPRSG
jgi:hypothetical protein